MSEDSGIRELAGRYRLITPLGRRVSRGWDLHLRQVVAIRLLPRPDDPDQLVTRLSALTDLSHPGLVRVLDAGVADGDPFVVEEFIAGTSLRAHLASGPLPDVAGLGSALAKALAYAHSQGVAHRDVQPGNILLGPGREPLLTNVGIAARATMSYMSPEEARGKEPGMASDVYSLGLVLLESLTGRVEYPGDDATTALARLSRAPIVDRALPHAATLSAMLSRNPNERPDAAACVDMLSGSSEKARGQTRTVLIAAVAAAVTATGIALVLNFPKQEPTVEQQHPTRIQVPLRDQQPVNAESTSPATPSAVDVPAATKQTPSRPQTPSDAPLPQVQELAMVPDVGPPVQTAVAYWYPWYPPDPPSPQQPQPKPRQHPAKPGKPRPPAAAATTPAATSIPSATETPEPVPEPTDNAEN